ncbi:unnamed protein product [Choristocarpus tenellus]
MKVLVACTGDGWGILIDQSSNSPDDITLDMEFSNSIQSLQDRTIPQTSDQLISVFKDTFNRDPLVTLWEHVDNAAGHPTANHTVEGG